MKVKESNSSGTPLFQLCADWAASGHELHPTASHVLTGQSLAMNCIPLPAMC